MGNASGIGVGEAEAEFRGADLGDKRLEERLVGVARSAAREPAASFPRQAADSAGLEATYRFLGNYRVSAEAIMAPHVRATVERCAKRSTVVIAHDTTDLNYGDREELGRLSGKGRGFLAHVALAVALEEAKEPLGVLHTETVFRPPVTPRKKRRPHRGIGSHEALRWHRGAARAHQLLNGKVRGIHVMDREADSFPLLAEMVDNGQEFVVRSCHDRVVETDGERARLEQASRETPAIVERTVPISRRKKNPSPRHARRHPPRAERVAKLKISTTRLRIARPPGTRPAAPATIGLNLVRVWEQDEPEGEPPVEWKLWTNLPIETPDDLLLVVDAYRCRWVIEEYFKALKTGCAIERRQLESKEALLCALALFAPIAWLLLRLRSIGRTSPESPGTHLVSEIQLKCLRGGLERKKRAPLVEHPTAHDILWGIAALGGHITNNGEPGWQVIGRGLDDLLMIEVGYLIATQKM